MVRADSHSVFAVLICRSAVCTAFVVPDLFVLIVVLLSYRADCRYVIAVLLVRSDLCALIVDLRLICRSDTFVLICSCVFFVLICRSVFLFRFVVLICRSVIYLSGFSFCVCCGSADLSFLFVALSFRSDGSC